MHTGLVNREIDDKTKDHIAYMGKLSNKSVVNVLVVISLFDWCFDILVVSEWTVLLLQLAINRFKIKIWECYKI